MKAEPALIVSAIVAFLAVLIQFGVPFSEGQTVALRDFLEIVIPLAVAAVATRQMVVSPQTVEDKYDVKPGATPAEVIGIGEIT